MERIKNRQKEGLSNIDGMREHFTDPTGEKENKLVNLTSIASQAMLEIYKSSGNLDNMQTSLSSWLKISANKDIRDQNEIGDIEEVLGMILARESQTRRFDHKFFGQIHPHGNDIAVVSDFIAAFMNTNTVYSGVSMAENLMEGETLDWLADMFGYERDRFSGNIVSGGTEANETAFWVAREWIRGKLNSEGRDPLSTRLYVLGSEMKHYSIVKICNKLGLEFIQVPERDLRTDPLKMQEAISKLDLKNGKVAIILGIAGGTETGIVDNLDALSQIAENNSAHFHVDAAYGGPFVLTKEKFRFEGVSKADSITIDPHKMLYVPYESGVILFKDKNRHSLITKCFLENAGYLINKDTFDDKDIMKKDRSYGGSRPSGSLGAGGAISTWATMKLFGNEGIKTLLDHTLKLTDHAFKRVSNSNLLTPLYTPELNTLLISLKNMNELSKDENNTIINNAIKHAATEGYYISSDDEVTKGEKVLRFVAMHPYSTECNVDELFNLIEDSITNSIKN